MLLASGCVTTQKNLVDSGAVTVDIQGNMLTTIHRVSVFQEGDEVVIRGHVNPHGNQSTIKRWGTMHIEIIDREQQVLKNIEVPFPVRHHKAKDRPDFYIRLPMILPEGSIVQIQYHDHNK